MRDKDLKKSYLSKDWENIRINFNFDNMDCDPNTKNVLVN